MSKLSIGAIFEKDGVTPKATHQHRVGRDVEFLYPLTLNMPMYLTYLDGRGFLGTSCVQDFYETDYGLWVTTKNSIYRLDYDYYTEG